MTDRNGRIDVAIVGTGNIAEGRHIPALRAQGDGMRLVAVVDVDPDRAEAFASRWDVPSSYIDLTTMLSAERPDLVVVCTPPAAHHGAVVECLEAGAWVWCEKPATLSLAEYDDIRDHEREGGPYAAYVCQHRFGSAAQHLRRQIAAGELGRPLVGVCNTLWYRSPAYFEVPWRGRWETEGGGPTMGHGIHQMDLMLSLLGDWREMRAMMGTLDRAVETEDVSGALVTFESGAIVSVLNSVLSPREVSYLRFDFTDGTVEVSHLYGYDNSHWSWIPAPHVGDDERVAAWRPAENVTSSHTVQLAELAESLRRGERPVSSGADGRRTIEFIAALYQSATTGKPVFRAELTRSSRFYTRMNGSDDQQVRVGMR